MPTQVFPHSDKFEWGYLMEEDKPHSVLKYGENEQRLIWSDRTFSPLSARSVPLTDAERETIVAFIHARDFYDEVFYVKNPRDFQRNNGGPGLVTLSGGPTVWDLPTSGRFAGDYPLATGHQLYDDGVAHASTVDTDARTFTTTSISGVITVDYDYYRQVRLLEAIKWTPAAVSVWLAEFKFIEVTA